MPKHNNTDIQTYTHAIIHTGLAPPIPPLKLQPSEAQKGMKLEITNLYEP